jgi:SAM-dependent methyltransferase
MTKPAEIRRSYDTIADEYAARIFDELAGKPLDRLLLDRFAKEVQGIGRVCDLGCGPGHVSRYLHERGLDVVGLDLSPRMIEIARTLTPAVEFVVGDMLALDVPAESWVGAVAFYSLIHFDSSQLQRALRELRRVLCDQAPLLIGVHEGNETRHVEEWWGHPVSLDGVFFEPEALTAELVAAGFQIEELVERAPYTGVEVMTERAYLYTRATAPARDQ